MPKSAVFRVNYYVGAILAQGGNIWLEDAKLIFSPTSAIDRAMGASDVEIPFQKIRGVEYKGDLMRSFVIKGDDKVHKFEGSQAKNIWTLLDQALKPTSAPAAAPANATPAKKAAAGTLGCEQCGSTLQPGYTFCPTCGTRIKSTCGSCHKTIIPGWAVCAFCGWKFGAGPI